MKKRTRNRNGWEDLNGEIVNCEACPRLLQHCQEIGRKKRKAFQDHDYWARPVPNLGDPKARFLIVGLAPAAHGANRTGRMFTGDRSGDWLFRALHRAGFANQAEATAIDDGLKLRGCAITAACHCAPPDNRPTREEIGNCRPWLADTFDLHKPSIVLALGKIAWSATFDFLKSRGEFEGPRPKFGHGICHKIGPNRSIFASYHPSQQNTFTGRLTEAMLDDVFAQIRVELRNSKR